MVLGIDEAGRYFLNGRPIAGRERSRTSCARIFAARTEDKILYFKADNQLKFGKIQEAVETARRAGVRVMAAITEPQRSRRPVRRRRRRRRRNNMAGGTGQARGEVSSEPNVVPMIDILLVLLIIFMITQPLSRMAMDVQVPPPEQTHGHPAGATTRSCWS